MLIRNWLANQREKLRISIGDIPHSGGGRERRRAARVMVNLWYCDFLPSMHEMSIMQCDVARMSAQKNNV